MNIDISIVARDLKLPPEAIERTVQLLDDGNTIPFITRFRKDQTGGLNEEQILAIKQHVASLRSLAERKAFILKSIGAQDKLTDQLQREIEKTNTSRRLEDLYHPFKSKKQSRAQTARQQGLDPLAEEIFSSTNATDDMPTRATNYVRVDKGLTSVDDVIRGVGDLLAERFGEDSELRSKLRKILWETGELTSQMIAQNKPAVAKDAPSSNAAKTKPVAEGKAVETEPEKADPAEPTAVEDSSTIGEEKNVDPPSETGATEAENQQPATPQATDASDPDQDPPETDKIVVKMSGASADDADGQARTEQPDASDAADGEDAPAPPAPADAQPQAVKPLTEQPEAGETPADHPPTVVEDPSEQPVVVKENAAASETPPADPAQETPAQETPAQETPAQEASKPTAAKKRRKKKKKSKAKKGDDSFKDYFDFKQSIKQLPHHRVLAINRGERANQLRVKLAYDEKQVLETAVAHLVPEDHPFKTFLEKCVQDALNRLLIPSLEREIRRELTERSEKHAVEVFATNLKNLLLQPPIRGRRVMAIDPGFKNGCSVALIDTNGQLIASDHVFVVGNQQRRDESRKKIGELVKQHSIDMIAIGNGVACRETEQMVSDAIAEFLQDHPVKYVVVNEAGASIYSTSEVGREELPNESPVVRSAMSIGRRLQDPLSELVKISPANIGVGLYQHDIKAKHLAESLDDVVQFCVNRVGVDVNTASPSLLKFVSGMNSLTARRVYEYRQEHGAFKNRQELKSVSGFGDATFVQAAGFLRVFGGDNPLDGTSIHPESYPLVEEIISKVESSPQELFPVEAAVAKTKTFPPAAPAEQPAAATTDAAPADAATTDETPTEAAPADAAPTAPAQTDPNQAASAPAVAAQTDSANPAADAASDTAEPSPQEDVQPAVVSRTKRKAIIDRLAALDLDAFAKEKSVGSLLMTDLIRAIKKPLWDPRDKASKPILRRGIIKADELKPEMQLEAQVVNVVDFGVFVDIGLGESCLVHVSQLANHYISDPQLVYAVGDVLKVWVTEVDSERRRVKLTAVRPGTSRSKKRRSAGGRGRNPGGHQGSPRGKSEQSDSRGGAQRRPAKGGKSARSEGGRAKQFQRKQAQRRPAKPKPVTPITDDMLAGDAPMRSFSDLLQFKQKKTSGPQPSTDDQSKSDDTPK